MANLSDTFKYISEFRRAGHQIGRKVGDMLEVLTYAALTAEETLKGRLHIEPKLLGFSEAGHKVEFAILAEAKLDGFGDPIVTKGGEISDPTEIIGFVECKKVGVEQTVNQTFKRAYSRGGNVVPYGDSFRVRFNPRDLEVDHIAHFVFEKTDTGSRISVTRDGNVVIEDDVEAGHRIMFVLEADGGFSVLDNNASLREIDNDVRNCKILEIVAIEDHGVQCMLNDCLSGPQTPEKAKQASFVALDVRRRRFGSFDKREDESECVSVLVLTEFAHWEDKSQRMILACIDRNLVVDDELIVEAFQKFEEAFGEHFIERITKDAFENDKAVRDLAISIVANKACKILRDIEDGSYKKIYCDDSKLLIA